MLPAGREGRSAYMRFYRLDFVVYPALLAAVLVMSSGVVLHRARLRIEPCLSALIYLVLDVLENSMVYRMLHAWPSFQPGWATVCGWVTLAKYIACFCALAVLLVGLLRLAWRSMRCHKQP